MAEGGGGVYVSSSKATRIMRCEVFRVSVSPRIMRCEVTIRFRVSASPTIMHNNSDKIVKPCLKACDWNPILSPVLP